MTDFRFQSPLGARVLVAGRERDYFSGTGYLGLQNHPRVLRAAVEALERYGLSTATSRGGYGEHLLYDQLESELRAFFGTTGALYFSTGYLGAAVLAQGLKARIERIFIDDWAHFSVWDGARAAGKPVVGFRHLDPGHLAEQLRAELRPGERPLVLSDGVFPISGEVAPLAELLQVVAPYNGWVGLDDAHAVGAIGPNGRGTPDYWNSPAGQWVASGTLSKALGGYGGILTGTAELLAELERNTRVTVAASPPPLPVAAASACALSIARTQPELRQQLWRNVARARAGLRALGWPLEDSPVPIICLRALPGLDLARLKDGLFERDICIAHVRNYSSTPPGGALRIAIFASHTPEQIDRLVFELGRLLA